MPSSALSFRVQSFFQKVSDDKPALGQAMLLSF